MRLPCALGDAAHGPTPQRGATAVLDRTLGVGRGREGRGREGRGREGRGREGWGGVWRWVGRGGGGVL